MLKDGQKAIYGVVFGIVAALSLTYVGVSKLSEQAIISASKMGEAVGEVTTKASLGAAALEKSKNEAEELTSQLEEMKKVSLEQLALIDAQKEALVVAADRLAAINKDIDFMSDEEQVAKLAGFVKFAKDLQSNDATNTLMQLKENVKDMAMNITSNESSSCIKNSSIQVCWGSQSISRDSEAPHTAVFNFKYPVSFSAAPTITNGINFASGGTMADVYNWNKNLSKTQYSGRLNNNHQYGVALPAGEIITMQFVAIGLP